MLAHVRWTLRQRQQEEAIPLYCLRSTFPTSFPRNIPEHPDWRAPPELAAKLDARYGPHTVDLFASTANKQFERFASTDGDP